MKMIHGTAQQATARHGKPWHGKPRHGKSQQSPFQTKVRGGQGGGVAGLGRLAATTMTPLSTSEP